MLVSAVGVQNGLTKLILKTDVPLKNYYTPLTSQVEELGPTDNICNLQFSTTQHSGSRKGNRRVRFTISQKHTNKDSTKWQQQPCRSTTHIFRNKREQPKQTILIDQKFKQGVP